MLLQKKIIINKKNHLYNFLLETPDTDPILFTQYSKTIFERQYISVTKEIKDSIKNGDNIIHIKNAKAKTYKVLTSYSGKVQFEGIEELIHDIHGVIGVMDTFPILYKCENESIMRAVSPRHNAYSEKSSQSSYNFLDWHVEAAYRPMVKDDNLSPLPDYLIFGIVHQGHQSLPIMYIALDDILAQMSSEDISIGLMPEFTVISPDSFSDKVVNKNIPLLVKNASESFYSRITFQNTIPETERAAKLLEKIKNIAKKEHIQKSIHVKPGDIVILNNKKTLHKRDAYEPRWDGKDRYFVRIYSVKDLSQGKLSDNDKPWIWE